MKYKYIFKNYIDIFIHIIVLRRIFLNKILILKNEDNDFERYISDKMRTDYVEVCAPYKKIRKLLRYIRMVCTRLHIHILMGIWLNSWKYKLGNYETIILFDNGASERLLKWIKKEYPLCKLKVWLWNVPSKPVDIFKKYADVYCFDEKYSLEHGFNYLEQFYFEVGKQDKCKIQYDLSFVGQDKGRYEIIKDVALFLKNNNRCFFFYVVNKKISKKDVYSQKKNIIKVMNSEIPYEKVIKIVQESKAVFEIVKEGQEGITLRTLEAMFYKKKLVTNNKYIRKYEWYNPGNIFILGIDRLDMIINFLDSPFVDIDKRTLKRHTYKNWLKSLTDDIQ